MSPGPLKTFQAGPSLRQLHRQGAASRALVQLLERPYAAETAPAPWIAGDQRIEVAVIQNGENAMEMPWKCEANDRFHPFVLGISITLCLRLGPRIG